MALKKVTSEGGGNIFSLPYVVARDEGYFADEGLELEFVNSNRSTPTTPEIVADHHLVTSFGGPSSFELGEAALYARVNGVRCAVRTTASAAGRSLPNARRLPARPSSCARTRQSRTPRTCATNPSG